MLQNIKFCFYLPLVIFVLEAQTDSLLSYYPYHTGNIWQYKTIYYHYSKIQSEKYYTVTIAGDTAINNNHYKLFISSLPPTGYPGINPKLQRIDSVSLQVFGYDTNNVGKEFLIDSLPAPFSVGFFGNRFLDQKYEKTYVLINESDRTLRRLFYSVFKALTRYYSWVELSRGLGITLSQSGVYNLVDEFPFYDYWYQDSLVYAKINGKIFGNIVSVKEEKVLPTSYAFYQNYPNPFNSKTIIRFEIPQSDYVDLSVYNTLGIKVETVIKKELSKGIYEFVFDASRVSSGLYFYTISAGVHRITKKMNYLK